MKSETEEKKSRCTPELQKKVLLGTAVLIIIFDLVAIILNAIHLSNTQARKPSPGETSIPSGNLACVLCTTLTTTLQMSLTHPKVRKLSIVTGKGGAKWCCAKSSQELSVLVALVLSAPAAVRKEEPLPAFDPTNFTFSTNSVQKRLWPSKLMENLDVPFFEEDANPLLFPPIKPDPLVEHTRGIEVMATNMVINTRGYYYVYSNIIFKPDSARPCKDYDKQTWDHNVILTRDGDRFASGNILRSFHTCCDNCRRKIDTSFTGGVLFLEENDKLNVEVSGYGLVSYRKEGSYFGLYKLGDACQRP